MRSVNELPSYSLTKSKVGGAFIQAGTFIRHYTVYAEIYGYDPDTTGLSYMRVTNIAEVNHQQPVDLVNIVRVVLYAMAWVAQ